MRAGGEPCAGDKRRVWPGACVSRAFARSARPVGVLFWRGRVEDLSTQRGEAAVQLPSHRMPSKHPPGAPRERGEFDSGLTAALGTALTLSKCATYWDTSFKPTSTPEVIRRDPELNFKSRKGYSIFHDALTVLDSRRLVERQLSPQQPTRAYNRLASSLQ